MIRRHILICLVALLGMPGLLGAQASPNIIYITVDGLNRDTLYALLSQNRLPNIKKIVDRGNYRNMDVGLYASETRPTYFALLTGKDLDASNSKFSHVPTLFETIGDHRPDMQLAAVFSRPQNLDNPSEIGPLLASQSISLDYQPEEYRRKAGAVGSVVVQWLDQVDGAFFLMVNFTDVDKAGHTYRQGGDWYSVALEFVDAAIGKMIKTLIRKGVWEETEIVMTAPYAINTRDNIHTTKKTWIASTQKIRYKGTQLDVVPTIYRIMELDKSTWKSLPGKPLVY